MIKYEIQLNFDKLTVTPATGTYDRKEKVNQEVLT